VPPDTRAPITRPRVDAPHLLLTARQTAVALAISERMLWELTARGELNPVRLPGRGSKARALRYDVRDLRAWIDRLKAGQATNPEAHE
jgi:hypothetical protein